MDLRGKRRSDNFEDRGSGKGGFTGGGGGGMGVQLLGAVVSRFGIKGLIFGGLVLGALYLFSPNTVKQSLLGGEVSTQGEGKVCDASQKNADACDFSRAILASTEDVWQAHFRAGNLPDYGKTPRSYKLPTLVVFTGNVTTAGCGSATSAVGPFYCSADDRLYIDPGFYDTLAQQLRAPGDFAQAYVIAHEIGHHVQNLIGSLRLSVRGETKNQASVRVELQADCFAGVWGHHAQADLSISDKDLQDATRAAHAIGDDALGHRDEAKFTHGSSEQRIRWFRRGFESGDPTQCDTFAVERYGDL